MFEFFMKTIFFKISALQRAANEEQWLLIYVMYSCNVLTGSAIEMCLL